MAPAALPGAGPTTSSRPRLGCTEPRIWTPPLRELTPDTSLGFDVIEFAEDDLGVELHPYQKWLYIHALELLENGEFRFQTIIILIARQNGKTTWWKILVLYVMYVLGMKLVLSTAQDLDTAEGTWQEVVDWVQETDDEDEYVFPDLAEMVAKVVQVNGKKSLNLTTGEQYKAKAASRRAGRGKSAELVGLDELREQQTWDSWSAITHTTMARSRSLIVGLSNAGDITSVVLRYLRKIAHASLGDPDGINTAEDPSLLLSGVEDVDPEDGDDDSLGIFEYSAPPGCPIRDWGGIAQANPSLNYPNGVPERKVRSAWREPEWVFRTEVMCQWSDGTLEGPFPAGAWESGQDVESRRAPGSPVLLGIDMSWNRTTTYIGLAARRADGRRHVEVIASRAGSEWVVPWLQSPDRSEAVREAPIVLQSAGAPVSSLREPLIAAGYQVVDWKGPDLAKATGAFYDGVTYAVRDWGDLEEDERPGPDSQIMHRPQPVLDVAAAVAVMKPGDVKLFDRAKSPADIAPLIAVVGAAYFLDSVVAQNYDVLASVR